jgi:hypothetical protein
MAVLDKRGRLLEAILSDHEQLVQGAVEGMVL